MLSVTYSDVCARVAVIWFVNTETKEEIWSTAVVIPMEMSLQRRYPNHYNVANEDGSNCCLELLPGMKWEVRRNNEWEAY